MLMMDVEEVEDIDDVEDIYDVEDVDDCGFTAQQVGPTHTTAFLIVLGVHDQRGLVGKGFNPTEHILRAGRLKIGQQLFVDRQVRGQDEEIVDPVLQVQVGDECPHEPRLSHTGSQSKAQR